ncbi:hypothetical protein HID58_033038 [Brassica napus]|uniref:Disease resistance protein n=1 Tax=Brassica napus TaxID=3708 RepID=A0ABQ8BY33_BRANA|nr:hypothetical protein HID58_033038 [Brassica napus]
MGNCGSFQISCDEVVNRVIGCLCRKGYIGNLKKNLRDLEREMEDLRASQNVLKNKVAREEAQQRQKLKTVQVWLTRVERIGTRVDDILSTSSIQLQKLCICGLCSKNICSSYKYGRNIYLLLEEVKKLRSEDNFQEVTELTPTYVVVERPTQPTVGQEEMLEKAWNRLLEDGAGIMGLHGMGGIGKTTLFKKIHNRFAGTAEKLDILIWIVVSQGENISKLQEDIARKLHLCGEEWTNKNESDKAAEIHTVLKRQRFVLMLDDIWEKMDLEAIRVPEPTIENGCKVVFTTRSEDVCKRMGDHQPMQVKCLKEDQAWELFKLKIGYEKLRREPRIDGLTRKVAEKCHGLPLALSIIGDGRIEKEGLLEYWICEGFMGEYQDLRRAVNMGYGVLVREMALWIASDLGKNKENFVVQAGVGLHQVPKVKDWGAVRRISLMGEVIQHMQKLVVLDLSSNLNISGLPDRISELNSLQYLDLSDTRVEQLPVGFQELKNLTHLNLARDVDLVKELQLLEHLQVLTIDVSSELGLKQILGDQRLVNCIYRLHIHDFQEKPFDLSLLVSMENLRELRVTSMHVSYMKCSVYKTLPFPSLFHQQTAAIISLQFRYELNIYSQCPEKVDVDMKQK